MSHVLGVRFSFDDEFVVSAGGHDCAVIQWQVLKPIEVTVKPQVMNVPCFIQLARDSFEQGNVSHIPASDRREKYGELQLPSGGLV
jgi:hypothetical protein